MNTAACGSPLDWDTLLAYWLGELDPDSEARTEEHYLGCAQCSRRLEELRRLAADVKALARTRGLQVAVNEAFVRRLGEEGLNVREYRVPRNGAVNCTVAPEDDFVVSRLEAPLAGVPRLDLIHIGIDGKTEVRHEDVPFDAGSDALVILNQTDALRALPQSTTRLRLLAVDQNGERILGEYTFNHMPWSRERN